MTTKDLADLLARRQAAWDELGHDDRDLRDLPPGRRMRMERASAEFRAADAAIVGELRRCNAPVRVGDVELHLTRDRLNFVVVDLATGDPACNPSDRGSYRSLLYRYPGPAAARRGAGA
jgi:hypothetical protein